jgi:arsenate reductase (glutaredoxin)
VIQIFGTPKCSASRAAQRFFAERKIKVQFVDLREKGLSKGELASVARAAGGLRALYAEGGARAEGRGLSRLHLTDARLADLLLEDPLLLRTPIVRDGPRASVGEDVTAWKGFAETDKR